MIQIVNYQDKTARFIDPAKVKVCSNYLYFYEELPVSKGSRWLINSLAKYRKYRRNKNVASN